MRKVSSELVTKFRKVFPMVQLHTDNEVVKAGPTRQKARELTNGDIIIYQDADDLAHYRRVEFVKHFLNVTDCLTLHHSWQPYHNYPGADIKLADVKSFSSRMMYETYWPDGKIESIVDVTKSFGTGYGFNFHCGAISMRRELLDEFTWKGPEELVLGAFNRGKAEDYEITSEIWFKYNKSLVIDAPVYFYR
jgi:hypothetical protein